ncbi:MAG: 1,4-alpha-glucan branching protein GlgB [Clostridia bacterium]|nr:1,4-alpha-glucan branching protein GlgB [Clostridia bacterium]MCI2000907.1 1,4-alpha-glucan branching protein GlgB [Clostridia bacterium]
MPILNRLLKNVNKKWGGIMVCSVSISQIELILKAEFSNPHSVLGMHEIKYRGKNVVAVREFIPNAVGIKVIDIKTGLSFTMRKIHDDGFFEVIIPNREKYFKYVLNVDFGNSIWKTYDQYTFEPTITDYDRYLFGSGTHYEIYKKLGSHIMTVDGVEGVAFAVWAPNAKSVAVGGTFNSWDERRSQMRVLGESGIWELFIPGVKENDIYKYRIKKQDGNVVEKTDPYGNFTQLRPETGSIVFNIDKYKWNDEKWIAERTKEERYEKPVNIYEVHLGSWRRYGKDNRFMTYEEAAEDLCDYVCDMGYTHIEFMPLAEHPFDGSWGYQVTGYFAPTSRYGTPDELMYLIDKCHQRGIGIILDWVPAHFPKDSSGLARFDGTALYEHQDPRIGEHVQWGTYIFNYGRKEVSNFLISNALFWVEKFHVDGLRVDAVASMLYLDYCRSDGEWLPNRYGGRENLEAVEFIKHLNSVMQIKHHGVMMMAEESTSWEGVTRDVKYNGLGFTFKWDMGWMNDFLSYIKKETVYRKFHHNNLTFSMMYNYNENFILVLSHDEVVHMKGSMMTKVPGDIWQKAANLRVAYGFMYAHPGKKLLFMGDEIGQFSEWSEERSLDWHLLKYDTNKSLQKYMKALNHFYLHHPALWQKDFDPMCFSWIDCDDSDRSLVSFERHCDSEELIFICNFTESVHSGYKLGVPESGIYKEILNSDSCDFGGSGVMNEGKFYSSEIRGGRCENSINITVPPLAICVFCKINS